MKDLKIISYQYFTDYKSKQKLTLSKHFKKAEGKSLSIDNFSFYFTASAVYSSRIEGNILDLDTFIKYREFKINTKSKSYQQINDLINAYEFAKSHKLSFSNLLKIHAILSKNLLEQKKDMGNIRTVKVGVAKEGKLIYMATPPSEVENELKKLFSDIKYLLSINLTIDQVFYFASMIHLCFAIIHPFVDGNGRTVRILEKWFLSSKLGNNAWFIQSEKLYHNRIKSYYKNINLGNTYKDVNFDLCIPFLLMLPMALRYK